MVVPADQAAARPLGELLQEAARRAVAPISQFQVGCVGQGLSGALYLGWNLEFPGQVFHQTVHAEQFVVALAAAHGERGLTRLCVTAAPCGHCRQFLCELTGAQELCIEVQGRPAATLAELIPHHFGPADLGVGAPLLGHPLLELPWAKSLCADDLLVEAAVAAARRSYAPYSGCPAGLAFSAQDRIYTGALLENAAYNPSLSPLQGALVDYYSRQSAAPTIEAVVLVEWGQAVSQTHTTRSLLSTIAPDVELQVIQR